MNKQRGGYVGSWLAFLLLAVLAASAALNIYQFRHHVTPIVISTQHSSYKPRTGVVPRYADACDHFGSICYLKI